MTTDQNVPFITLDDAGIGSIQPTDEQQERLEEFTQEVGSGEFHVKAVGSIVCHCIDGRTCDDIVLAPNAPGGTLAVAVAEDLTAGRNVSNDDTTLDIYKKILEKMKHDGVMIGGHVSSTAGDTPYETGCGASDQLGAIYAYIATNGATIHSIATKLGVSVSDETHELITERAAQRSQFTDSQEILTTLKAEAGDEAAAALEGVHAEVMAIINLIPGTTLDRNAVKSKYGAGYQAFNADVWAYEESAKIIADTPAEVSEKVVAMVYYTIATAGVLCGPGMRVVVLN